MAVRSSDNHVELFARLRRRTELGGRQHVQARRLVMRLRTQHTVSRRHHTYTTLPTSLEMTRGEEMNASILEFNEHMWHMSVTEPVQVYPVAS